METIKILLIAVFYITIAVVTFRTEGINKEGQVEQTSGNKFYDMFGRIIYAAMAPFIAASALFIVYKICMIPIVLASKLLASIANLFT